ncbi:MAG: hypothetical protein HC879_12165 [Leptolyngbyaceae cyanobacterium SL_5_9]|nr:hypothetical protein [Leptolyngbyaceae cyanobacterium SL_5_9]NJO73118.1 hypothetical protein [Leptolyngbyaceae cyanobacterium RM1_406_9]
MGKAERAHQNAIIEEMAIASKHPLTAVFSRSWLLARNADLEALPYSASADHFPRQNLPFEGCDF